MAPNQFPGISPQPSTHTTPHSSQEGPPTACPPRLAGPAFSSPQAPPSLPGHRDTLLTPHNACSPQGPGCPSALSSPTSQVHTSQGSAPGWKLSPGSYFRPSCSQAWQGSGGGLRAEQNQGAFRLAAMPGPPASENGVCIRMGATSPGTTHLCRPAQGNGREMLTGHCLPAHAPPPQAPSTRAWRAAVTGPQVRLGTGGDTLDAGTGDDTLMTHAGGTGAVGGLPATAFRVLLPMNQAACVRGGQG